MLNWRQSVHLFQYLAQVATKLYIALFSSESPMTVIQDKPYGWYGGHDVIITIDVVGSIVTIIANLIDLLLTLI